LNFVGFDYVFGKVVEDYVLSIIYFVDLCEEIYGYFDLFDGVKLFLGVVVLWYVDNDFGNVG